MRARLVRTALPAGMPELASDLLQRRVMLFTDEDGAAQGIPAIGERMNVMTM